MKKTLSVTSVADRAVHLVDIENLLGTCVPTLEQAAELRRRYVMVAAVRPGDLVVVGCCHLTLFAVGWAWGGARFVVRSGQDGADLMLLDVMDTEGLRDRVGRVVVGSGDGIFAEPAAMLQRQGLRTAVVTRRAALSRRLRLAVRDVRYLPEELPDIRLGAA